MALILINPPAVEPVSLAELKEFLRVDSDDTSQDSTLTALAMAGRDWVETETKRRLVQQTWRLLIDFFPGYIDLKLAGQKVSSPFVSGSNAVLVGIRYAIALPYPPAWELVDFNYQNANGQLTSMITSPVSIASVQNVLGQPLQITTSTALGVQTGGGIVVANNAALLAFLGGEIFQNITVTGPYTFTLNGTVGDGATSLPGGGIVTGYNFIYDLQSNPARLMPVFGQMWPVARVVANAIQVDYQCGYALPLTVNQGGSPLEPNRIVATDYTFQSTDIGRPISIWGAGANGSTLDTVISAVDSPLDSGATIRDSIATGIDNAQALLVNNPNANPQHWFKAKTAIKMYAEGVWRRVSPDIYEKQARMVIASMRDLRF